MKVVAFEPVLHWFYLRQKPSSPPLTNSVAFPSSQLLPLLFALTVELKATLKQRVTADFEKPLTGPRLIVPPNDPQPPLLPLPTQALPLLLAITNDQDLLTNATPTLHMMSIMWRVGVASVRRS